MKTFLAIILLSCAALSQDEDAIAKAKSACGPDNQWFDATVSDSNGKPVAPQSGKALVYVLGQDFTAQTCDNCGMIARVGVDGAWAGAIRGTSYISFTVEPGEHHLCANWQSRFATRSRVTGLANFTAEPDKIYYFRLRAFIPPATGQDQFDLDPINTDEGKYLLATTHPAEFHAQKPRKAVADDGN